MGEVHAGSGDRLEGTPFAIVPLWLIESGISGQSVRLYALLNGRYINRETGTAWPTRERLAEDMGKSVRTVDREIKELHEAGALSTTRHSSKGVALNAYHLPASGSTGRRQS